MILCGSQLLVDDVDDEDVVVRDVLLVVDVEAERMKNFGVLCSILDVD